MLQQGASPYGRHEQGRIWKLLKLLSAFCTRLTVTEGQDAVIGAGSRIPQGGSDVLRPYGKRARELGYDHSFISLCGLLG